MATLKAVDMKKLNNNINKIYNNFTNLKKLLKEEIIDEKGNISYDRVEAYDELFEKMKTVSKINKSLLEKSDFVTLEGKELNVFCNKVGITEDIFYKQQLMVDKITKFNLNKYIKTIKSEL